MAQGKCGALARKIDPSTLMMAKYLAPSLPAPPQSCGWGESMKTKRIPWGMMNNEKWGCCVVSGEGHHIQCTTSNNGPPFTVDDNTIAQSYFRQTGNRDSGLVIIDSLNDWRVNGLGGHRIDGQAEVSRMNQMDMKTAIWLFSSAFTGISLPKSTEDMDTVWDLPRIPGSGAIDRYTLQNDPRWIPGSRGGHCVIIPNYGPDNRGNFWLQAISWGDPILVSWPFWATYSTEAYAVLSPDWRASAASKMTPSSFDYDTLTADLGQFSQAA